MLSVPNLPCLIFKHFLISATEGCAKNPSIYIYILLKIPNLLDPIFYQTFINAFSRTSEIVLKSNIFEFDERPFKQKRGTAIAAKFSPPYAFRFMADLEEKMVEISEKNKINKQTKKNNDLVEVDQWHIFHLGTW